jgi:glyoxylase I family protein
MELLKIAHIALSVANLDKSLDFYKENFGLRCQEIFEIKAQGLRIAILKKDNVALELFEFQKRKILPEYRKKLGSDLKTLGAKHFAIEVADIKKAFGGLKKSGVRLATDIRTFANGLRYFFIKDPDGILVEIMEGKIDER